MKRLLRNSFVLLLLTVTPSESSTMKASWYDCLHPKECSDHKITANGEKFNPDALTAAHKTLPFGTKLKVTYNNKTVVVRVNDRGPFIKGRNLDLSREAARKIGCHGVCVVKVKILGKSG